MSVGRRQMSALERGFTLVEMLVALTVLVVLTAIAVPNLSSYTANQEVKTTAQSLYSTLLLARAEAIKRNAQVFVYPNGGDHDDWDKGWLISTAAGTKTIDCGNAADQANVLQANCAVTNTRVAFTSTPPAVKLPTGITFRASGRAKPASLTLCGDGKARPRTVRVELGGLPRIEQTGACP